MYSMAFELSGEPLPEGLAVLTSLTVRHEMHTHPGVVVAHQVIKTSHQMILSVRIQKRLARLSQW